MAGPACGLVPLKRKMRQTQLSEAARRQRHIARIRAPAFEDAVVINDSVGELDVVLIGDEVTRAVRAYGHDFAAIADHPERVIADGKVWKVEERGEGEE